MAVPNNFLPARKAFASERSGECGDERRGVSRYEEVGSALCAMLLGRPDATACSSEIESTPAVMPALVPGIHVFLAPPERPPNIRMHSLGVTPSTRRKAVVMWASLEKLVAAATSASPGHAPHSAVPACAAASSRGGGE
jgi:hypothetical protein